MSGDFRLLVGLGNPGSQYTSTRHNIGFWVLEELATKKQVKFRHAKKLHGNLSEVEFGKTATRVLMPTTYMNESGRSIRAALDWFDIEVSQLLVLVDDMDLPLGRIRIRAQGSSGGHNGLRSIIQHLGTENFCRIKIGIGSPAAKQEERKEKTIPHVLGTFSSKEVPIVNEVIQEVLEGLDLIQALGLEHGTNRLNSYRPKQ
ncbi:aminoacyl-tRNA hydrolase [Prochlorococcus sp. MIT 1307]|uniref:aminoacyl-tRNA hydrolase n=1 Tax=Prochlorococcus sp. MIT 1307 TaxID=3096219 RepID=UPI002A74A04F|nr:aminoacyl-tRNA hydrolase [Prochlorococcus sp. MIT 1307]